MKKMILIILFLMTLLSFGEADAVFCCQTKEVSGQYRCYTEGECCNPGTPEEFWALSCRNFTMWVSGPSVFRVSEETPIMLYLKNMGGYTDSYSITYEKIPNTNLIVVDLSEASSVSDVYPGETKIVYPRITVLSTTAAGDIVFTATSQADPTLQKNTTLTVVESELPLSLPEFGFVGVVGMIILASLVYIKSGMKKRK